MSSDSPASTRRVVPSTANTTLPPWTSARLACFGCACSGSFAVDGGLTVSARRTSSRSITIVMRWPVRALWMVWPSRAMTCSGLRGRCKGGDAGGEVRNGALVVAARAAGEQLEQRCTERPVRGRGAERDRELAPARSLLSLHSHEELPYERDVDRSVDLAARRVELDDPPGRSRLPRTEHGIDFGVAGARARRPVRLRDRLGAGHPLGVAGGVADHDPGLLRRHISARLRQKRHFGHPIPSPARMYLVNLIARLPQ